MGRSPKLHHECASCESSHPLCEALRSSLDPFMLHVWATEWIPDTVKTWDSTCCHTGTYEWLPVGRYHINCFARLILLCTQVQAQWSIMKTLTLGLRGCLQYIFFATQCIIMIFYNMIVSRAVYHILERLWEVERTLPAVLSAFY